jgi:hypothetical protein
MRNQLIAAAAFVLLDGAGAVAADLPTYELLDFPLSPVQLRVVGPNHVKEGSQAPTLMLGGMPASPHQVLVLKQRPRTADGETAGNLAKASFPVP